MPARSERLKFMDDRIVEDLRSVKGQLEIIRHQSEVFQLDNLTDLVEAALSEAVEVLQEHSKVVEFNRVHSGRTTRH